MNTDCFACGVPFTDGEPVIPIWTWGRKSEVVGGIHADLTCVLRGDSTT